MVLGKKHIYLVVQQMYIDSQLYSRLCCARGWGDGRQSLILKGFQADWRWNTDPIPINRGERQTIKALGFLRKYSKAHRLRTISCAK